MVYCPEMEDDFEDLVKDLAPSREYLRAGNLAVNFIFQLFTSQAHRFGISIDRWTKAGSIGKGTGISFEKDDGTISNPDYDCVCFVNNTKPPFDQVLDSFSNLLMQYECIEDLYTTKFSVQFTYKSNAGMDIDFDILPATNYQKHGNGRVKTDVEKAALASSMSALIVARNKTKGKISLENRYHSSAFAEPTVKFIKNYTNNAFFLEVIRLAKYWSYKVEFQGRFTARSYIMELIAIYAQRQSKNRRSIVCGFQRFLVLMKNFRTLIVSKEGIISFDFNNDRPQVHDPVQPYNDLTHGISKRAVSVFEKQAKKTLELMDSLRRSDDYENVENAIDEIFRHKW